VYIYGCKYAYSIIISVRRYPSRGEPEYIGIAVLTE